MIIAKKVYHPGFTEGEPDIELASYLMKRGYGENIDGGAELAHVLHQSVRTDPGLMIGHDVFHNLSKLNDPRNHLVASCIKHNCMSEVWWLIEREQAHIWHLYAGCWNERFGVMVLDSPKYHSTPLVWVSSDPVTFKGLLHPNLA